MTATNEALQILTAANIYKQKCIPNNQARESRFYKLESSVAFSPRSPPRIYFIYYVIRKAK